MFRFTAAAAATATSTADAAEPEVGNDNRKYSRVLDCLAACLVGRKQLAADADNVEDASPISRRSACTQSPTSSMNSLPVGGGGSSREFHTGGVNCLLAGVELSGGFRMSLVDGAVIRMTKELQHDVDIQMSPPTRQVRRQSSASTHHVAPSDDWQTGLPRHQQQRHVAVARLRRTAELLRAKITHLCDVISGTGRCAGDVTIRDRLIRYFERTRWLPVLDVVPVTETAGEGRGQAAVAVVVVCTTVNQLTGLRHHYDVGLLRDDLQHQLLLSSVDVGAAAAEGPSSTSSGDVAAGAGRISAAAQRRRLLACASGETDDAAVAVVDAIIDVVIEHDEMQLVKNELTQIF